MSDLIAYINKQMMYHTQDFRKSKSSSLAPRARFSGPALALRPGNRGIYSLPTFFLALSLFACACLIPHMTGIERDGFFSAGKAMAAEAVGSSFQDPSEKAEAAKPKQRPGAARRGKTPEVTPLNSRELTRALSNLLNPEQPHSRVPERFAITPLVPDTPPEHSAVPAPPSGQSKAGPSSPKQEEAGQPGTAKHTPDATAKEPVVEESAVREPAPPVVQAPAMPTASPEQPVTYSPKAAGESHKGETSDSSADTVKKPSVPASPSQPAAPALQSQSGKSRADAQAKAKAAAAPAPDASNKSSLSGPSEKEKTADAHTRTNADSDEILARRNIVRAEIRPENLIILSAPYDGVISAVLAQDGENVKKRQAVIRLDTRAEEHALASAKALSSEAFERLGTLPEGPSRERDALAAEYLRHSAAIKTHEARLAQGELSAPFAGTVTEVRAKTGEHVKQGSPIMEMAESGALEIVCSVPSTWVRWLKPGHIVWVYVDETAKSYEAVLTRLGGKVDPASKTLKVYARFSKAPNDLLPGMSGSASIRQQCVGDWQGGK